MVKLYQTIRWFFIHLIVNPEAAIEEQVRHLQAEEFARQLGGVLNQYAVT